MKKHYTTYFLSIALTAMVLLLQACEDFVDIERPRTDLVKSTVFEDAKSAEAAVIDIYYSLHFTGFASGDVTSLSFLGALGADEMIDYTASPALREISVEFYENTLTPRNARLASWWTQLYACVYKSNAIIEGVRASQMLEETIARRLEGEALFFRAFCHYYLASLWGDVPLATSTDYQTNASLQRTPYTDVFAQIVDDLELAAQLLPPNYDHANGERIRVTRAAALAMLARVSLSTENWGAADQAATDVIEDTQYQLAEDLTTVFQKTSTEAILQFRPFSGYANELLTFYVFSTPPRRGALQEELVAQFDDADKRRTTWISSITSGDGQTFYFPAKYWSLVPNTEYSTLIRLGEMYLIRAEARANLNNISGAEGDLNMIRLRAGLEALDVNSAAELLPLISLERRRELFTEWGHRWIDLKRNGALDAILAPVKPQWKATAALYPIPEYETLNSPVAQNPGY